MYGIVFHSMAGKQAAACSRLWNSCGMQAVTLKICKISRRLVSRRLRPLPSAISVSLQDQNTSRYYSVTLDAPCQVSACSCVTIHFLFPMVTQEIPAAVKLSRTVRWLRHYWVSKHARAIRRSHTRMIPVTSSCQGMSEDKMVAFGGTLVRR